MFKGKGELAVKEKGGLSRRMRWWRFDWDVRMGGGIVWSEYSKY